MKRAFVIVLDGCGAGATPDAAEFGDDAQKATIRNVWNAVGPLNTPHLAACGFLEACGVAGLEQDPKLSLLRSKSSWGRVRPTGRGKDSVTGHWEMLGIDIRSPFPTYPAGFPSEIVAEFERRIRRQVLGNKAASGTAIIEELGEAHVRTGNPILYTSADSVFQIAAHEDVLPIEELYAMCQTARELLTEPHNVQRVIARPFDGEVGSFRRTERRKDFPVIPPHNLADVFGDVFGIGVIPELFAGRGFQPVRRTQSNAEHEKMLLEEAMPGASPFVFANFEDFDMLFGHRNDAEGFGKCLEAFDQTLAKVLDALTPNDLLILTADHGNDPTDASTDHTREYVPFCAIGASVEPGGRADAAGLSTIGATVAAYLGVPWMVGTSILPK